MIGPPTEMSAKKYIVATARSFAATRRPLVQESAGTEWLEAMGSMHMLAKEGARVLFSGQSLRVAQVWFSWTWMAARLGLSGSVGHGSEWRVGSRWGGGGGWGAGVLAGCGSPWGGIAVSEAEGRVAAVGRLRSRRNGG